MSYKLSSHKMNFFVEMCDNYNKVSKRNDSFYKFINSAASPIEMTKIIIREYNQYLNSMRENNIREKREYYQKLLNQANVCLEELELNSDTEDSEKEFIPLKCTNPNLIF